MIFPIRTEFCREKGGRTKNEKRNFDGNQGEDKKLPKISMGISGEKKNAPKERTVLTEIRMRKKEKIVSTEPRTKKHNSLTETRNFDQNSSLK